MAISIRWRRIALAATLAVGCAPSVTKDAPVTTSSATLARFAPDAADPCNSVLPFPSDLARNSETKTLSIPYCKTDSADQIAIKTGLRTLDGYSLGSTLTAKFSGALDATTLTAGVKLFDSAGTPVTAASMFLAESDNTLYIQPAVPLKEATTYTAVITTDVKDAKGQPIMSDKVFVFLKSQVPLIDEFGYSRFLALSDADANALEQLRLGFAPMFDALGQMGLTREKIALAWTFTTQTVHASLPLLAGLVSATPAEVVHDGSMPAAAHPLIAAAGIPHDRLCEVHAGRVTMNTLAGPSGTFVPGEDGTPVVTPAPIEYLFLTPNLNVSGGTVGPCQEWTGGMVAVFAHGLGRCRNDALALANTLAKAGFATLAFDGPRAGTRIVGNLGDQNLDGCPDQPATPEFIALPGQSTNPFAIRDLMREWALEIAQGVAAVKAGPLAFTGGTGGTAAKIVLLGHSWGAMAAAMASSVTEDLNAVVLNTGSAELGAVFSPAIRAMIAEQLAAAGISPDSAAGKAMLDSKTAESVAAFRWAMEPGDPLYAATTTVPVLVQVVNGDGVTDDAPLHGADTQKNLAVAFDADRPASSFAMSLDQSGTKIAICDDSSSMVGSLLMPCVADKSAPLYQAALLKTAGMQRQAVTFAASAALTGQGLVCDPDYTKSCP